MNSTQQEAESFYQQGLEHAHSSEWGKAATCFRKALSLDPDSPAKESLLMVNDILDFYHKDNFNP